MRLEISKYTITQADLRKGSHGIYLEPSTNTILQLIEEEKDVERSYSSDLHIRLLEGNVLKDIRYSVYSFGLLGLFGTVFGLYELLHTTPAIAVNLKTKFPLIDNGSVGLVFGLAVLIGSIYSHIKRESILISKVKSKIIQHYRKVQKERIQTTTNSASTRKKKIRHRPKKRRK